MLATMLLMVQLQATGMIDTGSRPILTYTTQQSEEARWSVEPKAADIAATDAAKIHGGARAALKCTADKQGSVTGCEVVVAEPDRQEVKASALKMATVYRLNSDGTQKAKWSEVPPVIWLRIMFPDVHGTIPTDCSPAFGCMIEYLPLPPPAPAPAPAAKSN